MNTTLKYDHYYKYKELESAVKKLEKKYPNLVKVEVNCVTKEKRNQYVLTLTNKKTGDALSKPGWYVDGNIHAGEVTSSMAALHTADYLVTNYDKDKTIKHLLDSMTIYVIPRVTPDGAETYLSTPYTLRSVNREYLPEEGGIKEEDLDKDGVIRMMRIPTPYGAWKIDPKDKTTMTLRDPSDQEGTFYDIYPEGYLEEYDGEENLKRKKASWGLDFNRNFPFGWFPAPRQDGAGDYPLSNVETKAMADFVLAHPNIGGAAIGHTSGGIILYPPGTYNANKAPKDDIDSLLAIAKMGEEELGYKPLNIFDSFIADQDAYDSGAFDDWMYETQGIPCYTMEFWDLASKVGVPIDWESRKEEETKKGIERFNACMKWVKENAPQYYSDWKEYKHPTFGKVEIGGFNYKFTHQNPPEHLLLNELENNTRFNIRFIKAMPKLTIDEVNVEKVENGIFKVSAIVGNLGYLPTNLTDKAITIKKNDPVKVSIKGGKVLNGKDCVEVGDLSGYSRTRTGVYYYGNISTGQSAKAKKKVEWLVKAKKGESITIEASQAKSGKVSKKTKI